MYQISLLVSQKNQRQHTPVDDDDDNSLCGAIAVNSSNSSYTIILLTLA